MDYFYTLDRIIREEIDNEKEIAIYPFGKIGMQAKEILEQRYGRKAILIDNNLAKYNSNIMTIDTFKRSYHERISIIICSLDIKVNRMLTEGVKKFAAIVRNVLEKSVLNVPEKKNYFAQIKELCKVRAVKGFDLVRVGRPNDGGYIMLDDFCNNNIAYSFGIANDISWDKYIANRGGCVYCYDPSITKLPEEYPGLEFCNIGITGRDDSENRLYSMKTILEKNNHEEKNHMILKMDVEGAEWDFLQEVPSEILEKFSQLTFELHNMTDMKNEKIISGLKKLSKTHTPIWIHANNNGHLEVAGDYQIPVLLEITFVNNEIYEFEDVEYNCPILLDAPNIGYLRDIELRHW